MGLLDQKPLRRGTVVEVSFPDNWFPIVSVVDRFGGFWKIPMPCVGGAYFPLVVDDVVIMSLSPGSPGDPTIVGTLFPYWSRIMADPEAGVEYPTDSNRWGSFKDTVISGGDNAVVISPEQGIILDSRRTSAPIRAQLPEGGKLRVSAGAEAGESLLLGDTSLAYLRELVTSYNAMVVQFNTLQAWAVEAATALNTLGVPVPYTSAPQVVQGAPPASLVSSTFEVPSAAQE